MGVKLLATARFLVKLLIVTGWLWLLVELAAVNLWTFLAVFGLLAADYWLWLRWPDLHDPPRFFEWFPVGNGFYCWWMTRPRKERRS